MSNLTNFAALTGSQAEVWSRDIWRTVRQNSFFLNIAASGPMSAVHKVTELSRNSKGARAYMTLVADLNTDGATGDNPIWDREEAAHARQIPINIDQLRNATRSRGRLAEQRSVVQFRETARDLLGFWMADRLDQIGCHMVSGWHISQQLNGAMRRGFSVDVNNILSRSVVPATGAPVGYSLADLEFFSDGTGSVAGILPNDPTANRHFRWDADLGLIRIGAAGPQGSGGAVTHLTPQDTPTYELFVELKAIAKDRRIRPVRLDGGSEVYHVFLHPAAMARLKLDPSFLANLRNAGTRGGENPLFSGTAITLDGLVFHEITHMPTTLGAQPLPDITRNGDRGWRWGDHATTPGGVNGARITLLGAQGLAMADIGPVSYEEDTWDFRNQNAISVGKMIGFVRPRFFSPIDNTDIQAQSPVQQEDYGTIQVDVAI